MAKKTQIQTKTPKDEKSSKQKKKTTSTKKTQENKVTQNEFYSLVQKRAYELFIQRGCTHGMHEQDWYQAENEVKQNITL